MTLNVPLLFHLEFCKAALYLVPFLFCVLNLSFDVLKLVCTNQMGIIRACACDLGGLLRRREHLTYFATLFDILEQIAGLKGNSKKCVIS